jgi:hypothetical protein
MTNNKNGTLARLEAEVEGDGSGNEEDEDLPRDIS